MRTLAAIALTLLALGCSSTAVEPHGPGKSDKRLAMEAHGRAVYDKYCKLCHGADGQGYAADHASQLANPAFLATATEPFLYAAIDRGRPGTAMAAFGKTSGGPLVPDDIRALMLYLKSLSQAPELDVENEVVKGDAAAAKPVFAEHCAACHGDAGEGRTAPSLDNPIFLATASDGFIRHAIAGGRGGTPMPAFGAKLGEASIGDLTRLVRSWARNVESAPPVGEAVPSYEHVVLHPDGAAPAFSELRDGRFVPAAEVKAALDAGARIVVLDARPLSDWLKGHIPGAVPFPFYDAEALLEHLPRDGTWIVAYCGCPHAASGHVVDTLREHEYTHTAILDEGIFVWAERGYPMTFGQAPAGVVP
jgi:mono/diheme cytochrome c family protein/rhodanese-related sulfurtransferase